MLLSVFLFILDFYRNVNTWSRKQVITADFGVLRCTRKKKKYFQRNQASKRARERESEREREAEKDGEREAECVCKRDG